MDPELVLTPTDIHVDPGGETRARVTVAHDPELVEEFRLEVLGDAVRWAQVLPPRISFLKDGEREQSVDVVFRPPRPPEAPTGQVPFGVRCVSLEQRERCAVVEGVVSVGAVHDLTARLEPVSPTGRWTGRYRAHFDNSGSVPVELSLAAAEEKRRLSFAVAPRALTVPPGRSGTAYVAVRPRQPMLRGRAATHSFAVRYQATGQLRGGELPGLYEQRPVLSKGVVAAGLLFVLAATAGGFLLSRTNRSDGVRATDGPPPPTGLVSATELTPGSVQLVWQSSPYATGYVVLRLLPDGTVDEAKEVKERDQAALLWDRLKPGQACFRVLTVAADRRSAPSEPKCAKVTAPLVASTPPTTPTTIPPTTAPPSATTGTPSSTAPPSSSSSASPGVLRGAYAIYGSYPIADTGLAGKAETLLASLRAAGADAALVSSLDYAELADGKDGAGLREVIEDGFATFAEAEAACAAHRGIAPNCQPVRGSS